MTVDATSAIAHGYQLRPHPFNVLVKKWPNAYNARRIDDTGNSLIWAAESENLVRMLIEQIEPPAERGVDLALGSLSDAPETENTLRL